VAEAMKESPEVVALEQVAMFYKRGRGGLGGGRGLAGAGAAISATRP
jgi:hypothetical protein